MSNVPQTNLQQAPAEERPGFRRRHCRAVRKCSRLWQKV